jgi:very-short-patch-repair endonuclease
MRSMVVGANRMRAPQKTVAQARMLRRKLSAPEAMLWTRLRARSEDRPVFRRQHPIGLYVLDFYCIKAQFAVEIDGRVHEAEDRPERDARRDSWLVAQGVEVLRIPARDALVAPDAVADGVFRLALDRIDRRSPHHRPSAGPPPPMLGGG